ncbi:MAG: shikimate kinase [Candidatus Tantalella remota]|nr:shikimate kinase [Candidatus Tantalella remota]
MKNIVLIGFMGTGKTMLAKALADDLGMKYVSIDDIIVEEEGRPISEIFETEGEPHFRELEKSVVKKVSEASDQIIDTGGGVVLAPENLENLSKNGTVICLWADPEVIYERTKNHGHRPLLNVEDPLAKIRELLEYRRPFYEKAECHIDTTDFSIDIIMGHIKRMASGE